MKNDETKNKKYTLLSFDKIVKDGCILYRIQAMRSFGNVVVGDLGGYVESYDNLSHDGDCWTHCQSWVYGKARVYENAYIGQYVTAKERSKVYGNAFISGPIILSGNINVCEQARALGSFHAFTGFIT